MSRARAFDGVTSCFLFKRARHSHRTPFDDDAITRARRRDGERVVVAGDDARLARRRERARDFLRRDPEASANETHGRAKWNPWKLARV